VRHRLKGRKLGRTRSHREALERNIVSSLFTYGRIITTAAKAKEFRGTAEHLIQLAKDGAADPSRKLHNFRQILRTVRDPKLVRKIVEDVSRRFGDRSGGYTRVVKLGGCRWDGDGRGHYAHNRLGDNGVKAVWELVVRKDRDEELKAAGVGRAAKDTEAAKKAARRSAKAGAAAAVQPGGKK
jgi:large subunit ribosomal protein L17